MRLLQRTEEGLRFRLQCEQVADLIEQRNSGMQTELAEPMSRLTMSAPRVFARGALVALCGFDQQRHANVHMRLPPTDPLVPLVDGQVRTAMRRSGLSVRWLRNARAFFAASPVLLGRAAGDFANGDRAAASQALVHALAEAVRFELTGPCEPPVFKTGAIDHSATLPRGGRRF